MAHIKIAVFSYTLSDADRLVQHFCNLSFNGGLNSAGRNDSKSCDSIGRWDDYRITDCILSDENSLQIQAFITTDGKLFEKCQLAWYGLEHDEGELSSLFHLVFAGYVKKARQEKQSIYLVDCHI